ncbi:MAG: hypothetical protein DRP66_04205 [Planctomycetota bacterium]|nr:MAG: hypothetical protein DRP66_04205 [Planctomycetota bacterium]
MTAYCYKVHDSKGRIFKSTCQARSEAALRSQLKALGYAVNSIVQKPTSWISREHESVRPCDIVSMCRQFSIMYNSGLDLMDCLQTAARENESKRLTRILHEIHDRIAKGSSMADAFAGYPDVFSAFFINMIRTGEVTGKLDYVLDKLSIYVEKQYDLKRKIRTALTYPIMVIIVLLLVTTGVIVVVVPAFSEVYLKLGVQLPAPTRALIFVSDHLAYIFMATIALPGLCWITYGRLHHIDAIRRRLDRAKLAIPVYHKIVLLKFLQTLSLAISAGTLLSDAIGISMKVAANTAATEAADMIRSSIERGRTITEAVKLHDFFPQSVGHAFAAGEKSGELENILTRFAVGMERDVDEEVKRMITKIEPMIVLALSMVIGFVMLAVYLPIFDIMKMIR